MQNPPQAHRLAYLDALRGIAAITVCIYHVIGYLGAGTAAPLPAAIKAGVLEIFDLGRFGVVLFFLISGFIIPSSLKPGTTLARFAVKRFFRLYPAYWLACLLIFVLPFGTAGGALGVRDVLANLSMVPKLFHVQEFSGVFWTLFVEIVFYIGCAMLFAARSLEKPLAVGLVAVGLNLVTPGTILLNTFCHMQLPVSFLCFHLSFLFMGSVLRLDLLKHEPLARVFGLIMIALIAITVPVTTGLLFPVPQAVSTQFVMHHAAASAMAYFAALSLFLFAAWRRTSIAAPVVRLGQASYSLYLLHMLCIAAVAKLIVPDTPATIVLYAALSLLLAVLAAQAGYRLIEKPAMALGKRLTLPRQAMST
jgi:peptidoglycan/LPS O-acetylase OafA/YrhL